MYGQGNYAPQYRPPPPFQPPPLPHFQQAPPGPSFPPAMPPGPHPHPLYQQPPPSYVPLPPQPYFQHPPPIRGNPNPRPPPPPRMLPPPPPPPPAQGQGQGQGQPLYRTPPPPPSGIQHMMTPYPLAPPTSGTIMPAMFMSPMRPPSGDACPLSFPPPPPPPPPPSSPPPPPAPPTEEYPDAVPKVSPSGSRAHTADAPFDGVTAGEVGNSESRNPSVKDEAQGGLPLTSPPKPTEEEVVRNIEVLCDFIVKFGPDFENMARTKEAGNPKFAFLFGGKPGTAAAIGHAYFQWMKRKCLTEASSRDDQEHNGLMLTIENGEGSSQLDKMEDQVAAFSPAASDMDMEDDVGQPDVDKGEQLMPEIAMSMTISYTASGLPLHDEEDDKDSQFLEDVSPVRASPDATVCASEKNAQGSIWMPPGDSRMVKVSPTSSVGKTEEASRVYVKDGCPFRLIQGYASDDSEEDEIKETAEHNSIKFSPTAPASASGMHQDRKSEGFSSFISENISTEETISNLPTDLSKTSSMKMSSEDNSIKCFPHKATPLSAFCPSPVDVKKEVLGHGIFQQDDQKLDDRVGCERSQNNDISDAEHQVEKQDSSTVDVDEFGRLVRKGASDSESDEKCSDERPLKRGRSRSRSPQDSRWRRRSRTPRRRDKRSRPRSRSPHRSRIKSPLPARKSSVLARRDRDQPPECFNFNRGRCFHGASCRFLHRDCTWQMSRQQQHKEYPRDSRKYDDHAAAALSEPHKTAMTEMDVVGCIGAPQEETKSIEVQVNTEQCDDSSRSHSAGDFEENDPCDSTVVDALTVKNEDTQVDDQASQEVVTCMEGPHQVEKVSKSPYSKFVEESRTQRLQPVQPLQADSMSFQPSPRGPIQPSQATPTTSSEPQNFSEFSCGEESSSHPLPSQAIHPSSIHNQHPLTQSYPTIDQSSHAKEFPLSSISGTDFNYQVPPRPPGPHPCHPHFPPDNLNAPFASQHPRNSFLSSSTNYQSQPPPMNFFSVHRPPMDGEHYSPNLPPANPGWFNMPPPPHSHSQVSNRPALPTSDFPQLPQQNSIPPRYDFNPMMRPYSPGERGRPLGGDFHMEESRRRPLPMENRQGVPFAGEEQLLSPPMHEGSNIVSSWERDYHLRNQSFLREEAHRPLAGQGSAPSSSFAQGDAVHPRSMPLPGESFPYRLHSFPADQLNPRPFSREEFSTLAKDMPYSYHPPPYGQQQPASSDFTLNPGGSASVDISFQRHPSNFPEKPPQSSDIGMHRMPISSHNDPFASTFDQAPTSLKAGSGIAEHENDTNYSSRYDSSHMSGHVPMGGVVQRLTTSPPNSAKPREQFLSKAGIYSELNTQKQAVREPIVDDQYDPLCDSIESSSNPSKKLGRAKEPKSGVIDAGTYPKLNSSHRSADGDEHKGGAVTELRSDVDEYGEVATDAEVGDVDNASPQALNEKEWSPALPIGIINEVAGEIEIDQVRSPGKSKKSKDSRSMRVFKIALADFVKEILKPSWRQGNMSKEAFKTIVKKTVEKVSGAMSSHQIPKSQAKIHQYVESSQRKLTKLVMGYVNKYVKM